MIGMTKSEFEFGASHMTNALFVLGSVMVYALVLLTHPKTIFFDVSILMEKGILMVLRKDFSGAAYSSK